MTTAARPRWSPRTLTDSRPTDPRDTDDTDSPTIDATEEDGQLFRRLKEAVALRLWQLEAVRVSTDEPFRLASGRRSPIYVNCRRAISDPPLMQLFVTAARLLCERRGLSFEVVAGGETAGIPFAAFLASALGKPMVYVRKKPKGHGLASQVEGHLEPGQRVLLVEDLITDGGSKLGFFDALQAAGGVVGDVLVLFDRQQGGDTTLAERGVALHAVAGRRTTLAVGEAEGFLSAAERRSVDAYFTDADAWESERGLELPAD